MKCYLDLWRRAFDYKGISTLREFWLPFVIHAAAAVVMGLLFLIGGYAANIAALIIAAFLIISAVPFAALTVRRLHDVGRSGWLYFLWFGLGIGAVVLMVILACSGGGFSVFDNAEVCVYGPPPSDYNPTSTEEPDIIFDPADNIEVDVYGPPPMDDITPTAEAEESTDFDPADNIEEVVYGSPSWFGITEEAPAPEPDSGEDSLNGNSEQNALVQPPVTTSVEPIKPEFGFNPADNLEPDVYGPPEWFGSPAVTDESIGEEDADAETEEFYPTENLPECVYGPPEWFGITEDNPPPENISE